MIRQRTLDNGVRVVTEPIPQVRSCGIGVWIEGGSRLEPPQNNGVSHFIEHMLFMGTGILSARRIGDRIDWLGGRVNAFTTQETICLHARTIDAKAHLALDLIGQLLTESIFPADEFLRERQVILEECKMYEDTPDDLTIDRFIHNLWPDHPLGRPVIGTRSIVRKFSCEGILDYWRRHFRPRRLVVALAGSYDARACSRVIRRCFGAIPSAGRAGGLKRQGAPSATPRRSYLKRPVEQIHFCLGTECPHRRSPDRYAIGLMNTILGGGMSSRLFQEIREKRGLAYSIGSFLHMFHDRGYIAVSGGTSPSALDEVVRITLDEMVRICEETVSPEELDMARQQVLDDILMGLENTESRMMRLGESLLTHGRVLPIDEAIDCIQNVSIADVRRVARKYLRSGALAVSMVGPRGGRPPSTTHLSIARPRLES